MKREVHAIPPAPRRIRLRALVAHRWPLLAGGAALTVLGGLIAWLMFLQSGGKLSDGARLDAEPKAVVDGTIRSLRHAGSWDGETWDDVRYEFVYQGDSGAPNPAVRSTLRGGSFVRAGAYRVGSVVPIEVLASNINVSRVQGGVLSQDRQWLFAQFWIVSVSLPGTALLILWFASIVQLRHVLVHGDVAVARVTSIRPVRVVLPEMLRVDYTFRDHRARSRSNHHWVRVHGDLGARLLAQLRREQYEDMPVLHDRRLPQWNRMLLPQDFLPALPAAKTASSPS